MLLLVAAARAEPPPAGDLEGPVAFIFAAVGSTMVDGEHQARTLLRAVDQSRARFVVHFDLSPPSPRACAAEALERRRRLLEANAKPTVPIAAAAAWATCGRDDPQEKLARLGDLLFAADDALGQGRLRWIRQSALPRFSRYRENLRWQVGNVLFVAINLPDNNNNFRFDAGRNGEFEERVVANRAWLERAFRLAAERRMAGIVIFVDASPRFALPLRLPDGRLRERDGYVEWKIALATLAPSYAGQVLVVQGHGADGDGSPGAIDRPLRDASGRPIDRVARTVLPNGAGSGANAGGWLRIEVDPHSRAVFTVAAEQVFDDPTGELYGPARNP